MKYLPILLLCLLSLVARAQQVGETPDGTLTFRSRLTGITHVISTTSWSATRLAQKLDVILFNQYVNGQAAINTNLQNSINANSSAITNLQNGKVDKLAGLGLSSNDYTNAEKVKLAGVATGATANSTDAQLRDRSTHTGTQPIGSVTGLQPVLDVKADTSVLNANVRALTKTNQRIFYLEDFGGKADGNPTTGTGTINNVALVAALNAAHAAGGGVIELRGVYRVTTDFDIPTSTTTANPYGVLPTNPIRITGSGHHTAGEGSRPQGGAMLLWTASGNRPGRITAKGEGTLEIDHITLSSLQGIAAGNGKPFIYHTNTTLLMHETSVWTQKQQANCDDDVVVSGGTSISLGNSDNAPFQGYSTIIQNNWFNGVRRGWYARTYCNANRFLNNTFWNACGSNLPVGTRAAVEIHGDVGNVGNQYAVSNVIAWNLLEISSAYDYGIRLSMAAHTQLLGNDSYDSQGQFTATVRLEPTALATNIMAGMGDGKPYVSDATNGNYALMSAEDGRRSVFKGLQAGTVSLPNQFGPTSFSAASNDIVRVQGSGLLGTNRLFGVFRSPSETTGANAPVFGVGNNGTLTIDPDGVTTGVAIQTGGGTNASFLAGMRQWMANGSGGEFIINTGSGGSYLTVRAFAQQLYSHTGTLITRMGNLFGGNGLPGIAFGSGLDVELYRSGAGGLRTNAALSVAANTNADAFVLQTNGTLQVDPSGLNLNAQLLTNPANGAAASLRSNLTRWVMNGAGGNMEQSSGAGGSFYDMKNYAARFFDHTGAGVARIGNLYGGNGFPGIGLGNTFDVSLYRPDATTLRTDQVLVASGYRVSALNNAPTSATAPGTVGEIRITAGFIYVCIATNTWVRATLSTF